MLFKDLCHVKDVQAAIVTIESQIRRETGLNLNQAFAICCLEKGGCRAGELAQRLRILEASLSRVIRTLRERGLIDATEEVEDARGKVLTLSPSGRAVANLLINHEKSWFPWTVDLV